MAIEELAKPAGRWCPHCRPGHGCLVYESRPSECRAYNCLWLIDDRFGAHWKPNKSKLVVTSSQDGLEIRCDPGFPNAWRKEPYLSDIKKLATAGEAHDITVLVIVGDNMTLVTPDREFQLGAVGEDKRILREFEGTRFTGATVVNASDPDS